MKSPILLAAAACLLSSGMASATVTLAMSNPGTGVLTNIANFTGTVTNGLHWGIVVDSAGDGFDFNSSSPNQAFTLATYSSGVAFPNSDDDVIFMDFSIVTTVLPGGQGGPGSITTLAGVVLNFTIGAGVNTGDPFALIWFDDNTGVAGVMDANDHFGVFTTAGGATAPFVLPADGATQPFAVNFVGADPVRAANLRWIAPEPSSLLLSLLGVLPVLRRRR
jgi:hypothetical protein